LSTKNMTVQAAEEMMKAEEEKGAQVSETESDE
jgi:hypothetical protein